jgi:hypothetical protein
VTVVAAGVITGWGCGVEALPGDARAAAGDRDVLPLERPRLEGDRFRRATRECLLGVAAVEAMLADGAIAREALRGSGTALVYVTATAYAAANRAFIEQASGTGTLHFPYTAPSAVPAEVAIEFGLTGPYLILTGGIEAARDALWHAVGLLGRSACERALVLSVDTVAECADLFARARWLTRRPLVETAVALLLTADAEGDDPCRTVDALLPAVVRRAGETLAGGPLLALALGRARARAAESFA